jgi:hypothetical protein
MKRLLALASLAGLLLFLAVGVSGVAAAGNAGGAAFRGSVDVAATTLRRAALGGQLGSSSRPRRPTISGFSPASGAAGAGVTITGTNFSGASAVAFNGTAASYTVSSATKISTTVPLGAASGPIRVTTAGGTATSSRRFTVTGTTPRSVTSGAFQVQWSQSDPEEITSFSWNGSPNLTNTWTNPGQCTGNPDLEFFGNAWGLGGVTAHPVLVGGGTTGTWTSASSAGSTTVHIASAANGCPPQTADIPVATSYQFPSSGNTFTVQRTFSFGTSAFASDLRPYIPRLFPDGQYTNVYYPTTSGTLAQANEQACDPGCEYTAWNGTWFAVTNWSTGHGLIVTRTSPPAPVALFVKQDDGSGTSATSVLLLQPTGGFTGTVTEAESLCFYSSWTPSLTLPAGC